MDKLAERAKELLGQSNPEDAMEAVCQWLAEMDADIAAVEVRVKIIKSGDSEPDK